MSLLRAEGLHYTFPGAVPALCGLDLEIRAGEVLALLGPNGAGKSTLFLHLNGTLRPDRGRILKDGRPLTHDRRALNALRAEVALVLQDPDDQLFAATVFEDVSFGPLNLGLTEAEARLRVEETLTALGLADLAARPTHMLSGGQKKRVAIAGAVAMRPRVLLLDEPTAGLDHAATGQVVALLQALAAGGMTLAFSTHDVDLAWRLADRVALFRDGRVERSAPAGQVLTDPAALEALGLRPPLLVELWLRARALGLTTAPPPRDLADFAALMAGWRV